MHDALKKNVFLVKEHVGMFKAANNYDIHDPQTGDLLMECREERLGFLTKLFRFTDYKRMTPFDIQIRTPDGQQLIRITRGISIFLSTVIYILAMKLLLKRWTYVGDWSSEQRRKQLRSYGKNTKTTQ